MRPHSHIALRLRLLATTLCAVALAAGAAAFAGCATHAPPPLSAAALAPTRAMRDLEIYWVGMRFEGIPLTAADRPEDYLPGLGLRVYYGDCGKRSALSSGGCTLPLEINSIIYHPHPNTINLGTQHNARFRGVPAIVYDGGRSILLYTDRVEVDVYADSPARARRAVQALVTLNVRTVSRPGTRLPPPLTPLGPAPK